MSKAIVSLPERLVKNSLIGALFALVCYVGLQFFGALLIHCEMVGEGAIYPFVCFSAGLSSFVGCGYTVVRGGSGSVLSASAVALVFLALTFVIGLLSGEAGMVGAGMVGIGGAMVVGGLLAALVFGLRGNGCYRDKSKSKRKKKQKVLSK